MYPALPLHSPETVFAEDKVFVYLWYTANREKLPPKGGLCRFDKTDFDRTLKDHRVTGLPESTDNIPSLLDRIYPGKSTFDAAKAAIKELAQEACQRHGRDAKSILAGLSSSKRILQLRTHVVSRERKTKNMAKLFRAQLQGSTTQQPPFASTSSSKAVLAELQAMRQCLYMQQGQLAKIAQQLHAIQVQLGTMHATQIHLVGPALQAVGDAVFQAGSRIQETLHRGHRPAPLGLYQGCNPMTTSPEIIAAHMNPHHTAAPATHPSPSVVSPQAIRGQITPNQNTTGVSTA